MYIIKRIIVIGFRIADTNLLYKSSEFEMKILVFAKIDRQPLLEIMSLLDSRDFASALTHNSLFEQDIL